MTTLDEKSASPMTNILTITRPTATRQQSNQSIEILSTIEDVDSTLSLTPTHTTNEKFPDSSPLSPFYKPGHLDAQSSTSKLDINRTRSDDTDLEACLTPKRTGNPSNLALLKTQTNAECTVWPGQAAMRRKKMAMRRERGKHNMCGCMAGLDKRTKLWVKLLIAFIVLGAAVGVGLGVSKAVGGGVWKNSKTANAPISTR